MPSRSPAQHRLMEAVAHDPAFAAKVGIPQDVGQEFSRADEVKRHDLRHPKTGCFVPAKTVPAHSKGRVGYGLHKGAVVTQ